MCALLRTISVFIFHFQIESVEFYEPLAHLLTAHAEELSESELTNCVSVMAIHSKSFLKNPLVTKLSDLPPLAAIRIRLHLPVDNVSEMLVSVRPSDICIALRVMKEMVEHRRHARALKTIIPDAIVQSARSFDIPPVVVHCMEVTGKAIQTNQELRSAVLENYHSEFLLPRRRAAFTTLAVTLPALLTSLDSNSTDYKKLVRYCDGLLSEPYHFEIFRIYCDCIRARLRRELPANQKAEFVTKSISEYFAPSRPLDGYEAEKYLGEWTALLRQFVPLDKALRLMARKYGRLGRPLPALAEIAKMARDVRATFGPDAVTSALTGAKVEGEVALAMIIRGDPVHDIVRSLVESARLSRPSEASWSGSPRKSSGVGQDPSPGTPG
jgi:hypothetical protein